ncbi:hypothetical protein ABKA04_004866 [Annulohypoxylon sp. FPYF3050]
MEYGYLPIYLSTAVCRKLNPPNAGAGNGQASVLEETGNLEHKEEERTTEAKVPDSPLTLTPTTSTVEMVGNRSIRLRPHRDTVFQANTLLSVPGGTIRSQHGDNMNSCIPGLSHDSPVVEVCPGTRIFLGEPQAGSTNVGKGMITLDTHLDTDYELPEETHFFVASDRPLTIGNGSLWSPYKITLQGHTLLKGNLFTTDPMEVPQGQTIAIPDGAVLTVPDVAEIQIGEIPARVYRELGLGTRKSIEGNIIPGGTILDAGAIIPAGSVLPPGTVIPPGTAIPSETEIPPRTTIPPRTLLPKGTFVPERTLVEGWLVWDE